jgi:hypothetical protein
VDYHSVKNCRFLSLAIYVIWSVEDKSLVRNRDRVRARARVRVGVRV